TFGTVIYARAHARCGWQTAFAPYERPRPVNPVALEGDHAARRTVGPDPSPHQPSGEARRVVPGASRHGARRCSRGEPATGDGAAHLPPDPPVSTNHVVGGDAAPQCAAPAGQLGVDLRRLPELQRAGAARPARN